ncbi:disintegrin and metalloproteinase with thrombospondin motifs adt-1-like isoform X2 [Octopus vulgaris]|uniref:Disintegrin and metalloproteinase with thrombospondin motifs adt-1-like isoform X2 n=1 Tax=Octopus vulgaris TaxID=6645 RepID=A0AA36BRK8_OCTVU|nr:disintegrin and metalloproteinase with thrombospondin motifs adt-1-like isoform X2 [Octopus vulgaris]
MLSYNWVDRNLYSVAYSKNAESIDSDELEDYVYSRWYRKVPKPILKKASGIFIKKDQTAWKNMPNKKHTPWVLLKSDMVRHNGDDDDDSYMRDGSSDNDEDDVSGEEEEEEEDSMYDRSGNRKDVNSHHNDDDIQSYYLLREKIYKDIDKLAHKCSLPLKTRCLSTVFYHVFKNLMKNKNMENIFKSKEQNVLMHQSLSPSKSLHQLLEDVFLKKFGFLPHSSGVQNQNFSDEDRNKLLLKIISVIHEDHHTDTSKNLSTNPNAADLHKQTEDKNTNGGSKQSLIPSSSEASMEEPQILIHKPMQSKWKRVKPVSRSEWKRPEIKISFDGNELNMNKDTYLGLEYFYKLIGILNDLKINFTYSPQRKAIFVNPQSLLAAEMQRNFLNIQNLGWQKRKPFKVQIDFHKDTANNSQIILKTGKNSKNDSDSSEIKIEFLQPVKNISAKPTAVNVQSKTSFTPQPDTMTTTQPPPHTEQPPPHTEQPPPHTEEPPPHTEEPPPPTEEPPPPSPPLPQTTTNHSSMDVNININVNDNYINKSLKVSKKKVINITHIHIDPKKAHGAKRPTVPSVTHLGEWTVWYKWSPCSTSCGIGHRKRHRMCLPPGFYCPGNHSEKASCFKRHCDLVATIELSTPTTKKEASVKMLIPTGHWTIWQGWSQCSSSCGLGIRKRTRVCLPYSFHCEGDLLEMASCIMQTCDSANKVIPKLTTKTTKQTKATNPIRTTTAKPTTTTTKRTTAKPAVKAQRPPAKPAAKATRPPPKTTTMFSLGKWKAWHEWSECSVSCGYGIQRRERICLNSHCIGFSTETVQCMERHCESEQQHPIAATEYANEQWSSWTQWSDCSVKCGSGHRTRYRTCSKSVTICAGHNSDVEDCVKESCFVGSPNKTHSSWTSWSEWSHCSSTCDSGNRKRFRSCLPKGSECEGNVTEDEECMHKPCQTGKFVSTGGHWAQWSQWSNCSVDCGSGQQRRRRTCQPVSHHCEGDISNVRSCMERSCFPGQWGKWGDWSQCSAACGRGQITKTRLCIPTGAQCPGKVTERMICMKRSCDKENVFKPTSVLQGKFTKLKCCSQKNCHRSKYKWLMPDGKLIVPSNSSENRFFAVNEYLIIEKTQKKDKGTYRCLKIDGNSAKGIELPLVVHTCANNPCLNKGICKDTVFSPHRLYKTVCKCPSGYLGSVCQIEGEN